MPGCLQAGVTLYNTTLKKVPIRKILWWSMLLGVAFGSTQLILITRTNLAWGLSDQLFVLGDSVMLTVLGQVGEALPWVPPPYL